MDKLFMDNYLLILKSTVEVYVHGTLESSNKKVKNCLKSLLNDTLDHQEETYNEMIQYNWYKVTNVSEATISKVLNKCN